MNLYLFYTRSSGSIYPALLNKVYAKDEYTYKGAKKVEVERVYVQGLRWNVKYDEILPCCSFLKDVEIYFVLTDDVDGYLRKKLPKYR